MIQMRSFLMPAFAVLAYVVPSVRAIAAQSGPADSAVAAAFQDFRGQILGSYGALATVEPSVSAEDEVAVVSDIAPLLQEKPAEALARLEPLLRKEGRSAAIDFMAGNLHFQLGRMDEAATAYRAAIARFPSFRRAYKNLAFVLLARGDMAGARRSLAKTIELGDESARVYGLIGHCLLAEEAPTAAESAFRRALVLDADNRDWKVGLVRALVASSQFGEARAQLDNLIAAEPDHADFWLLQANAFVGLDDLDSAAVNLEIARRLGKATPEVLGMLANLYLDKGLGRQAAAAYMQAFEQSPRQERDQENALKAARYLVQFGALDEAEAFVARLGSLLGGVATPRRAALLEFLLGQVAARRGDSEGALVRYEAAVRADSTLGDAFVEAGVVLEKLDRTEEAAFRFQTAARIPGSEVMGRLRHGQMLVRRGRFDEALPLLKEALKAKPSDSLEQYVRRVERAARNASVQRPVASL